MKEQRPRTKGRRKPVQPQANSDLLDLEELVDALNTEIGGLRELIEGLIRVVKAQSFDIKELFRVSMVHADALSIQTHKIIGLAENSNPAPPPEKPAKKPKIIDQLPVWLSLREVVKGIGIPRKIFEKWCGEDLIREWKEGEERQNTHRYFTKDVLDVPMRKATKSQMPRKRQKNPGKRK